MAVGTNKQTNSTSGISTIAKGIEKFLDANRNDPRTKPTEPKMRRVSPMTSPNGNDFLPPKDRSPAPQQQHLVHGPWNRKSITTLLSQQQHNCYGSRRDNGGDPSSTNDPGPLPQNSGANNSNSFSSSSDPSYSMLDLVSVGVGGTVGSGIFVLTGYIANHYAGPATFLSFLVSGAAALCSGVSFAEFSGRLPRIDGSTYTYAYVSMGEYAAVLVASCLTLEYGVSGAAVARSWGDKVLEWRAKSGNGQEFDHLGETESLFNPLAGLISIASVLVLAWGVTESKRVTNFFTVTKMGLVAFMIVGGFGLFRADNMVPLVVPAQASATGPAFGAAGILRGATSSFFGYLGFDEVVCLAGEAKNPADIPRAVLWTLAIVTVVYILASIALTGMLPYQDISDTSGFPNAFDSCGIAWASNLTAFGEVFTLPVVVLITLLAQTRLFAAMARDGLLPEIFALQSGKDGNLLWSNFLCGIPMALLATFVPFSWMDDAISVGILFAFNMTNTALVIMRCNGTKHKTTNGVDIIRDGVLPTDQEVVAVDEANGIVSSSYPVRSKHQGRLPLAFHLCFYHAMALMAGLTSHWTIRTSVPGGSNSGAGDVVESPWWSVQIGAAALVLSYAFCLYRWFPDTGTFGDDDTDFSQKSHHSNANFTTGDDKDNDGGLHHFETNGNIDESDIFKVPLCPFLPLVGVFLNWYLISQLEWSGMILLLVFLVVISMLYVFCISGRHRAVPSVQHQQRYSPVLNPTGASGDTAGVATAAANASEPDGPILLREMSLPRRTTT